MLGWYDDLLIQFENDWRNVIAVSCFVLVVKMENG